MFKFIENLFFPEIDKSNYTYVIVAIPNNVTKAYFSYKPVGNAHQYTDETKAFARCKKMNEKTPTNMNFTWRVLPARNNRFI